MVQERLGNRGSPDLGMQSVLYLGEDFEYPLEYVLLHYTTNE